MKTKFYLNLENYCKDTEDQEMNLDEIIIVNRGKWVDIDCNIEAKTVYAAFKKLATALKNNGFIDIADQLFEELKYKDDFAKSLEMYNKEYPYPEEMKNGFFGYTAEDNEGTFYIRHFTPTF